MIYNIIGRFTSCYRTPRADSVLCGANYSDLWKCRLEDWSNKERRIMFFLESLGKSTAQHLSPGKHIEVQVSEMSNLNDNEITLEKKKNQDD